MSHSKSQRKIAIACWLPLFLVQALLVAAAPAAVPVPGGGNRDVRAIHSTIIIPRQNPAVAVPAPFGATQPAYPGGELAGSGQFQSVLRFDPQITGQLIKTENFGDGTAGRFWNNNNHGGDTTQHGNQCSSAHDFTVDGRAEFRPYPAGYTAAHPKPDIHGPDMPQRADGLSTEGNGFYASNLRFYNIPGTAVVVKQAKGGQDGFYGPWDMQLNVFDNINVGQAINGMQVDCSDVKLSRIFITAIAHDGLIVTGPGTRIDTTHIEGCDRDAVFDTLVIARGCYHEAARIGTDILPHAFGTRIDGLDIGPHTCWERGVRINANRCTITGLTGSVAAQSATHPDVAGVEIMWDKASLEFIEGMLMMTGEATGVIFRGHHNELHLRGGWDGTANATFVRVASPITTCKLDITCGGNGGTVLDLSASGLDKTNGLGNEITIRCAGTATPVLYPGGGTKFNLAPGSEVTINGVQQRGK